MRPTLWQRVKDKIWQARELWERRGSSVPEEPEPVEEPKAPEPVLAPESLYLDFAVYNDPTREAVDRESVRAHPLGQGSWGFGSVPPTSKYAEFPPPYNEPICAKLLPLLDGTAIDLCYKPLHHEGDHGREDRAYAEWELPEPIIVGVPPNRSLDALLKAARALVDAIEDFKVAIEVTGGHLEADDFGV